MSWKRYRDYLLTDEDILSHSKEYKNIRLSKVVASLEYDLWCSPRFNYECSRKYHYKFRKGS